jgi:hypothetical protein
VVSALEGIFIVLASNQTRPNIGGVFFTIILSLSRPKPLSAIKSFTLDSLSSNLTSFVLLD